MDEIKVHGRKIKLHREALDDEEWTDGRLIGIIELLMEERQRAFEEQVAAHLAKTQGTTTHPESDVASVVDEA